MSLLKVNISLRVWHPSRRAEEIATALSLAPRFAHNVGDNRVAPSGEALEGKYEQTYVTMPLVRKVEVELGEELIRWCSELEVHAEYLRAVVSSGGKAECYVSVFLDEMGGFELPNSALSRICALGLGFAVELYTEASD